MKIFFTLLIMSTSLLLIAQDVEFKKKNFSSEEDYTQAITALEAGDNFFFDGNFQKALPRFLEAQALNPNNAMLNFKIGACYLKNDDAEKALPFFEKAQSIDPLIDPKLHFALAQSYQANKKYKEAIEAYQTYLNGLHKTKRPTEEPVVQKQLDICQSELQKMESAQVKEVPKTNVDSSPAPKEAQTESEKEIKPENKLEEASPKKEESIAPPAPTPSTKPTEPSPKTESASPEKVTFRIQIASMSTQASTLEQKKMYSGNLPVSYEKVGDQYKYYIGDFGSKEEALKAKSTCGIADAFIVKFVNGRKL